MNHRIFLFSGFLPLLACIGCSGGHGNGAETSTDASVHLTPKDVGGKYGYVDSSGNMAIEPQFDYARPFSEGRALVKMGKDPHGKYGFIDATGEMIIPATYDGGNDFSEGLASVGMGDANGMYVERWGFINPDGAVIIPLNLQGAGSFHEGLASFSEWISRSNSFKVGFIDKHGEVRIPAKFDTYISFGFKEGLAPVRQFMGLDEYWGFIDIAGNVVVPCQYQLSVENERYAIINGKGEAEEVWMNKEGKVLFSNGGSPEEAITDDVIADEEPDWRDDEAAGDSTLVPVAEPSYGSVTDIDGITYSTVKIGEQEWMAQNLSATKYQNGDPIPFVSDAAQWTDLLSGACASYKINPINAGRYGLLYNWYTVVDPRKVCPAGWHIPTDAEWTVLTSSLGGKADGFDPDEFQGAGGKMKSTGTKYWNGPNTGATDESGFSGLPSGYRYWMDGEFLDLGSTGSWWSGSRYGEQNAWCRDLYHNSAALRRNYRTKTSGISVRCLRD